MRRLAALYPQEMIDADAVGAELSEAEPPAESGAAARAGDAGAGGGAPPQGLRRRP